MKVESSDINYDANGWFTLDLHASTPTGVETSRTGDYSGLCCVVVPPPSGVTVYFVLETRTGDWAAHLTSHARPDPEPHR